MTETTNGTTMTTAVVTDPSITGSLKGLGKMSAGINIAPNYFEFADKGQKVRGVFVGFSTMEIVDQETGEVKELQCAGWVDADQNVWLNGGRSLVSAFEATKLPLYTPIEIEYLGSKKVAKGNMKQYAVRPLTSGH